MTPQIHAVNGLSAKERNVSRNTYTGVAAAGADAAGNTNARSALRSPKPPYSQTSIGGPGGTPFPTGSPSRPDRLELRSPKPTMLGVLFCGAA